MKNHSKHCYFHYFKQFVPKPPDFSLIYTCSEFEFMFANSYLQIKDKEQRLWRTIHYSFLVLKFEDKHRVKNFENFEQLDFDLSKSMVVFEIVDSSTRNAHSLLETIEHHIVS